MYKVPSPIQQTQAERLRHVLHQSSPLLEEKDKALRRVRYILPSLMSLSVVVLLMAAGSYQFGVARAQPQRRAWNSSISRARREKVGRARKGSIPAACWRNRRAARPRLVAAKIAPPTA